MTLNGVVYVPNGALSAVGNGSDKLDRCLQVIANVINFDNSGGLTSHLQRRVRSDCSWSERFRSSSSEEEACGKRSSQL